MSHGRDARHRTRLSAKGGSRALIISMIARHLSTSQAGRPAQSKQKRLQMQEQRRHGSYILRIAGKEASTLGAGMMKKKDAALMPVEHITRSILALRRQRVLLDRDLAEIYGVSTGRLNEAIKRNTARFPEDFIFQLTEPEAQNLRSQIAISSWGGRRYLPFVFTEYGAIQAANVLRSPRAIEMSLYVVRAFVQLREMLASNQELAQRLDELERKLTTHDQAITGILKAIRELMRTPEPKKRPIGFTANLDEEKEA
jgi:hypothetical protein